MSGRLRFAHIWAKRIKGLQGPWKFSMVGQQLSQLDLQETAGGARAERGETSREEEIEKGREMGAAAVTKLFLPELLNLRGLTGCNTPYPGFAQRETNNLK